MMSRAGMLRPLAIATLLSCLMPGAIRADDNTGRVAAAVNRAFRPLLAEHDVPGLAIGVTLEGRSHVFGYGVASRESGTPVTRDTLFEIGSVSKAFTATFISYAQALGRISLDDHPGKYMPQLRGSAIDRVTLRHLGTYTAGGLPLQFPAAVTGPAQMIAYYQQWTPSAAPGKKRQYSNPSLGLLGHIAGLAMNGDFASLVATEIFAGLGLTHTHIRVPAAATDRYAWGYDAANRPIRVNPGVFDAENYGVKSTAADLIRFVELNIRPGVLKGPLQQAVEGTHIGYFRFGDMVQGLGWEQYPYPITLDRLLAGNSGARTNAATQLTPPQSPAKSTLYNKTGSTNGFGAYVAFVPDKEIGIVMMANRNIPIPVRITAAYAVLEQLAALKAR